MIYHNFSNFIAMATRNGCGGIRFALSNSPSLKTSC